MHGRPVLQSTSEATTSHPNRWRILGVLVLALLVTSIDHTIINVALPQLVEGLKASSADLQWVVASYTIVFAGLLLTAGSVGDRFGRRHALAAGLATFLAGSIASAMATSTTALIVGRGVMGVGGALIMPTTLSILVNVFGDPRERAKAIAVWTAASGLGIALGPIAGGMLMRSFSWSSVFWINVPLLAAALLGTLHLVPDSRNPEATKLDPVGALLSIGAIGSLVYAIITAPAHGWTSTASLTGFAAGPSRCCSSPGSCVATSRCSTCACSPTAASPPAASRWQCCSSPWPGTVFLQAQYLQFILGYTPLVAGFALVPAALGMLFGTGAGAHMNAKLGGRVAVATGTLIAAAGVAAQAAFIDGTSYLPTGVGLLLFGLGAGIAMPAATDLIMATLPPPAPASAPQSTTPSESSAAPSGSRSSAASRLPATRPRCRASSPRFPGISEPVRHLLTDNVGSALHMSGQLGANGTDIASVARTAFVNSMSTSLWVAVGLAVSATVMALVYLPRAERHGHAVATDGELAQVENVSIPIVTPAT